MLRALSLFVVGVCTNVLVGLPAFAQSPAEVTLTRIDCGTGATPTDVGQRFTDTFAYKDLAAPSPRCCSSRVRAPRTCSASSVTRASSSP